MVIQGLTEGDTDDQPGIALRSTRRKGRSDSARCIDDVFSKLADNPVHGLQAGELDSEPIEVKRAP